MIDLKSERVKYISTVLTDLQCPFIWEFFRPGTIPLPGERAYYDEASKLSALLARKMIFLTPLDRSDEC
jgi:hypothetical protein